MIAANTVTGRPGWTWAIGGVNEDRSLTLVLRHNDTGCKLTEVFDPVINTREDAINRAFSKTCGCPLPHLVCGVYIFHHPQCNCSSCTAWGRKDVINPIIAANNPSYYLKVDTEPDELTAAVNRLTRTIEQCK